ncbi:serine/threonine-protein kinase PLK1 [Anabrus simplex]|uniref:serine/threonine-protein kinase PLK1 n=1 Tax=Anabrus simplex TaxID=316456 RepID=UPI0035A27E99
MNVGEVMWERWVAENVYNNNDSFDSGIAGIRDTETRRNCERQLDNAPSCSEYIVDQSTKTTYMKGRFLGKGGFAHVHELMDLTTNTIYAGKIIPKANITKKQHMQKIAREIIIHRELIHEHVVRLHHFFEDKINAYIILENCPKKSLVHVLKHRCLVTEPEARYYLRQLISGVHYIHSCKVIHRDLKPGNMLLSMRMVVKLADFGLATQADKCNKVSVCGTPNYIAPEVLNKLSCSYESDVWAIGCIMYTILVGQAPFETASLRETYMRIVNNNYSVPGNISEHASGLIQQLLHPKPEARPSLDEILKHDFFTCGYTPKTLSPACCFSVPKFPKLAEFKRPEFQSPPAYQASPKDDVHIVTNSMSGLRLSSQKKLHIASKLTSAEHFGRPFVNAIPDCAAQPTQKDKGMSLMQKLSSMLCPDSVGFCRGRICDAATLYGVIVNCIDTMPYGPTANTNPHDVNHSPLFVSKWIDYSNKYGFGFQLTDKSVGVLFNDSTRMSFTPDRSRVEFHDVNGKITAHPEHSVPLPLQGKLMLLKYFSQYMDEHLTEGGDLEAQTNGQKTPVPHMKRWVRTVTAIIMELHNGTLQINFFKDHTKLIISLEKLGYLVTFINSKRQSCSYWVHQIAQVGCENNILERLHFAAAVLREFAELDGVKV